MQKWLRVVTSRISHKIALTGVWLGLSLAVAQAADLSVSPANTYLQVDGGEEKYVSYTLHNRESQSVEVTLELKSFTSDSQTGQPQFLPTVEFPYVTLVDEGQEVTSVTLAGEATRTVLVKVAPPLGVAVREYPLTLLFSATAPGDTSVSGSSLGLQVGSNLIIRLDSSNDDKSQLAFSWDNRPRGWVDTLGRGGFAIKVTNSGPFGTLIDGRAVLRRGSQEVARWDFYPDLVLGNNWRLARGSDGQLDANGHRTLVTQMELPRWLLGWYTLEVTGKSILDLSGERIRVLELSFLALPYWLILLAVVIGIIVVIIRQRGRDQSRRDQFSAKMAKMKAQKRFFE